MEKTFARAAREGIGEPHRHEQMITGDVGRWARTQFRRSPLIISPVVDA